MRQVLLFFSLVVLYHASLLLSAVCRLPFIAALLICFLPPVMLLHDVYLLARCHGIAGSRATLQCAAVPIAFLPSSPRARC